VAHRCPAENSANCARDPEGLRERLHGDVVALNRNIVPAERAGQRGSAAAPGIVPEDLDHGPSDHPRRYHGNGNRSLSVKDLVPSTRLKNSAWDWNRRLHIVLINDKAEIDLEA
jgi:hypothetical protein